ncbi:MAG: hypothetical protein ACP5E9_08720 [Candidatus Methanospirareceae archaeon]
MKIEVPGAGCATCRATKKAIEGVIHALLALLAAMTASQIYRATVLGV